MAVKSTENKKNSSESIPKKTKSTEIKIPESESTTPLSEIEQPKVEIPENKIEETESTSPITEIEQPKVEIPEIKTPETESTTPLSENDATKVENAEIKTDKTENAEINTKRVAKTVNFTDTKEFEHINSIVTARIEAGITRDWNHFIRQSIDYTINSKFFDADFATGKEDFYLLKDAFFTEAPIKK